MFKTIDETAVAETVAINFEGKKLQVPAGKTVMASILAADPDYTRTTGISHSKRSGYCQMGVCFDCLMEIDGVPNQQACMIEVRDGMTVKRQEGLRVLNK